MAMFVQHNMAAMNANRMLGSITGAAGKTTEKLASGYRINRAADDAAGLAISEKMRGQIRGLNQASTNAQDGISLIQTAEGALAESHSILQRMRELAVQAGNGTETDEDRSNIQDEIAQLQDELDRIAETTEFNTMKLLDGSYSASGATSSSAGPKYGQYDGNLQAFITSNVAGVTVTTEIQATAGGESAHWDATGKNLKLNLAKGVTYTQGEIDELIANATQEDSGAENAPASVTVKFSTGMYQANAATTSAETVAGTKATTKAPALGFVTSVQVSDTVLDTAEQIEIVTKDQKVEVTFTTVDSVSTTASITMDSAGTQITVSLATGVTYKQEDIDKLIKDSGIEGLKIKTDGEVKAADTQAAGETFTTLNVAGSSYDTTVALTSALSPNGKEANISVESSVYNMNVNITLSTSITADEDKAEWDSSNNTVTITLATGQTYKQSDIDALLADMMKKEGTPEVKVTLRDGDLVTTSVAATDVTATTATSNTVFDDKVTLATKDYYGANQIKFTSNKYGADYNITIDIDFSAEAGKEGVTATGTPEYKKMGATDITDAITQTASYKLSLQAGKEYSAEDIEAILAEAGLDIDVELFGNEKNQGTDGPNTLKIMDKSVTATIEMAGGTGIGDEDAFLGEANYNGSGNAIDGLSLQVGANQGQTISFNIEDMSATALGVSGTNVRVDEQDRAQKSITVVDAAIQKVSKQRSTLGAIQNRLEHTIANLDTSAENLQNAESRIRDTDMAEEMVTFSKNNILQQAAQSMLAQANQSTQGVLSLLG